MHISSANQQDGQADVELLWQLEKASDRLELIRADHAYCGHFEECAQFYEWQVEIS